MIVYFSGTGNSRWCAQLLADKLQDELLDCRGYIKNGIQAELISGKPWVFVAPTYETEATDIIEDFLETGSNRDLLRGFAGSGNLNFNTLYCFTAKDYSRDYKVPLLHQFEFQGTQTDVER